MTHVGRRTQRRLEPRPAWASELCSEPAPGTQPVTGPGSARCDARTALNSEDARTWGVFPPAPEIPMDLQLEDSTTPSPSEGMASRDSLQGGSTAPERACAAGHRVSAQVRSPTGGACSLAPWPLTAGGAHLGHLRAPSDSGRNRIKRLPLRVL